MRIPGGGAAGNVDQVSLAELVKLNQGDYLGQDIS